MRPSRILIVLLACGIAPVLRAQSAPLTGFASTALERQRALEAALAQVPDTAVARRHVWALSSQARVAGTPAQEASATYALRAMAEAGLDTVRATYRVYLPIQDSAVVELLAPEGARRLSLEEPVLAEDSSSGHARWPAMNGYSGVGDVRAALVYANYGMPADYRALDSLGVSVQGKVVIARYGQGYRGIKAREAERRGAAALIIYSDPADDGWGRGDPYPVGPYRHPEAVERGSVNGGEGDPSTPGAASVDGVARIARDRMTIPRIPVVPVSARGASQLLGALARGPVPQAWQGGLPFRYHTGTGEVTVRVAVWADTGAGALRDVHNTLGILRGSEFPDELVIMGAHRDAWGAGAADNASGTTSVLEAARAWAEAARAGRRPRRTLVFATWDAEEWGLVGSTEWVEQEAERLRAHAVAYVNQDMVAHGPSFGIGASPSLRPFAAALATELAGVQQPRVGDMGSGSDFSPFQNGIGVPSLGYGFGGPHGGYHSAYDSPVFVERFGDPGFRLHAQAARIGAIALARLAQADVLPTDGGATAQASLEALRALRKEARTATDSAALRRVEAAAGRMAGAAASFAKARDRTLAGGGVRAPAAVNAQLRRMDRAMVGAGPTGPRNLVVGSQRETRYGSVRLPGLAEALADRDAARLEREAAALVSSFDQAAAALRAATAAL